MKHEKEVRVVNYPNPCDTCEQDCGAGHSCPAWRIRFRTIWEQFNTYPLRQYRKAHQRKKFCYEHPDVARKYLAEGPCEECQFRQLCDAPCVAYYSWWDARMAALKKKYGME